ncbi:MAG: Crp/Fnr family transcriptional regulator [Pseudonocardiaceae bacterium]
MVLGRRANAEALRHALWVSRCVGRADTSPLRPADVDELARRLRVQRLETGQPLHRPGAEPSQVCIVRDGCIELAVPSASGRLVIQTLRAGDVDGDIQMLLGVALPYEARASMPTICLLLGRADFEALLAERPALARRWLTSVSARLARSHDRLTILLGQSLQAQVAQLLLDESHDGVVPFAQSTLAAMLGARRPSVNRILRRFVRAGVVELKYRSVHVLDRASLERLARS